MPIVRAKCTNCGANLSVDSLNEAAICQYCDSAFVVEKAINNYNITNHIQANVVNIYENNERDFEIRGGVLTRYIGESMFVNVPKNIVEIGSGSFEKSRIKRVIIPMGVETISYSAFCNCLDLEQIEIPSSVKSIGEWAFACCEKLGKIVLPDSVISIGEHAFSNCNRIEKIVLPDSVREIGSGTFSDCVALRTVSLPNSAVYLPQSIFSGCVSLTTISLPKNLKGIPENCFKGCSSLKEIAIPPCVYEIGFRAFWGCTSLERVNLPEGLNLICRQAFTNCESLEHIHLSTTIKKIEHEAFSSSSLTAISFPHKEVEVEERAFINCKNLIDVHAPRELVQKLTWKFAFIDTPYYDYLVIQERKRQGACLSCGSQDFTLFGKCKRCGKKKDY